MVALMAGKSKSVERRELRLGSCLFGHDDGGIMYMYYYIQ
jgi:hypothetical protein